MQIEELYQLYLKSTGVSTDTRRIVEGQLFFALTGEHFNGNEWAQNAVDIGANYAIIDQARYEGDRTILVEDVLASLQELACYHRQQYQNPVIGLTGSNGKTTTKELIHLILSSTYEVNTTAGNFNNHIGVPLTLLRGRLDHDFWLVEMGTNSPGEIEFLCDLADPDFGLITNIGAAHLEKLVDLNGVLQEKTSLFRSVLSNDGYIFLNRGDELLRSSDEYADEESSKYESSLCGYGRLALTTSKPHLSFEIITDEKTYSFDTRLIGRYNQDNISAALTIGAHFEISINDAIEAISAYEPDNMRSQLKQTERNLLLLDNYNANPTSMKASITSFIDSQYEAPLCIVGEMLESGVNGLAQHKEIVDLLTDAGVPFYLVGAAFCAVSDAAYDNVDHLQAYLSSEEPLENKTILLKGSRGVALERLLDVL